MEQRTEKQYMLPLLMQCERFPCNIIISGFVQTKKQTDFRLHEFAKNAFLWKRMRKMSYGGDRNRLNMPDETCSIVRNDGGAMQ